MFFFPLALTAVVSLAVAVVDPGSQMLVSLGTFFGSFVGAAVLVWMQGRKNRKETRGAVEKANEAIARTENLPTDERMVAALADAERETAKKFTEFQNQLLSLSKERDALLVKYEASLLTIEELKGLNAGLVTELADLKKNYGQLLTDHADLRRQFTELMAKFEATGPAVGVNI